MKKVAFFGECMVELNGALPNLYQTYGGDTLNGATYLARLASDNVEVHYVTAIGQDPLSSSIRQSWEQDGIKTDYVMIDHKKNMGLYLISVTDGGERSFTYWRNDSAAKHMMNNPQIDDTFDILKSFDMLVLSGITLGILTEPDRQKLFTKIADLRQAGVTIVFDSNYRPALWENKQATMNAYDRMFTLTDIALVTLDDEQNLRLLSDTAEIAADRILSNGVRTVVVKDGPNGSSYFTNLMVEHVPTTPVQAIDTTAAGDSYNAGFLSQYLNGAPLTDSCRRGNEVAGIVIQHRGAIAPQTATAHLGAN